MRRGAHDVKKEVLCAEIKLFRLFVLLFSGVGTGICPGK